MDRLKETNPHPKLFILPKETSSTDTRILTLEHPRTALPFRCLFCPRKGIYELTKIAAPRTTPTSVLLSGARNGNHAAEEVASLISTGPNQSVLEDIARLDVSKGYITRSADLFVATPIDPLYLLLPALQPSPSSSTFENKKLLFRSFEDHLESLVPSSSTSSTHLTHVLCYPSIQQLFEKRMMVVCDTVDAGDERMYRMNNDKLLAELFRKAHAIIAKGLPSSLEENFVTRPLDLPVVAFKREESSALSSPAISETEKSQPGPSKQKFNGTLSTSQQTDGSTSSLPRITSLASEESILSTAPAIITSTPDEPTATTSMSSTKPTSEIVHLLRLRTALTYIMANYLSSPLSALLNDILATTSPSSIIPDFTPLDQHLSHLATLRQEIITARSLADCCHKRSYDTDDAGPQKRRQLLREEDEEKKKMKMGESRGVRDLKKVDTSGMKKLSFFFKGKAKT